MSEATESSRLIHFESFEVNLQSGELRRAGERVQLPEQSFQILAMLLERPHEVVMRQEIQKRLWPNDTVVEFENSINAAVKRLRLALEDSADQPRYIETLARRGYRWMVPVERVNLRSDRPEDAFRAAASAPAEPTPNLTGKKVSHYRVLEILGGGGMGVIYKAEDLKLGRRVALKFLPDELGNDPKAVERFEREARAASTLDHPNICSIYEFGEHDGHPFIVMQLLEGQTLRERIGSESQAGQPLPVNEFLDLGIQIASGLEAAHHKGVVHRDIKPANIFATSSGQAKILDFGLAKLLEPDTGVPHSLGLDTDSSREVMNPDLTATGVTLGTAGYMSPEQVRGESLDARTDLFSFGLVLYEMATGQRVFSCKTAAELHDAILTQTPTPTQKLNPELPPRVQEIINKMLEKDRELRYQHASDVRTDLQRLKSELQSGHNGKGSSGTVLASRVHPAQVTKLLKIAVPVLLIALIMAGGFYYRSRQSKRLTEKDTIVLSDFANSTGDPVFDDTLKTALNVSLQQSPFLNVVSDSQIAKTLQQMTVPANTRLTPPVARELCQRASSKAYIAGAIGSLGSEYVLGLKAVNCQSGDTMAHEQVTAASKEKVLNALGEGASKLRGQLGESLATLQRFDVPLAEATTSSLEALKTYSLGIKAQHEKGFVAALPYYQRALQLDPNLALCQEALGGV